VFSAQLEDLREQVRQVEIPGGTDLPKIDNTISILGSVRSGDTQILWIRHDGTSDEALREKLGTGVNIHTIGLEEIYLAIAEHRHTPQ
jgi:hypothetical protein